MSASRWKLLLAPSLEEASLKRRSINANTFDLNGWTSTHDTRKSGCRVNGLSASRCHLKK